MRSRRDAMRSLMPSRSVEPADSLSSVTAASRNFLTSPVVSASRSTPSDVERTPARILTAAPTRRLASTISMVLASHTVQVTTDAKTRPISTAFTTGSALMYMPQGLRSRGSVAVPRTLSCARAGAAATIDAVTAAPSTSAGADRRRRRARRAPHPKASEYRVPTGLISHSPSSTPPRRCNNVTSPTLHGHPRPRSKRRRGRHSDTRSRTSTSARGPSFRRLQLAASGGAARRDLPTAPSAPPPHDDSGHGKYQREHAGQEHDELPDRPAVAALVDPAYPLRRAVAGERAGQTRDRAAAVIDGNARDLAALGVAQLHAPDRTGVSCVLASALLFSAPRACALAAVRTRDWQEYDGGPCAGLRRQRPRQRVLRRKLRVAHDRAEGGPRRLRIHRRDRRHELPRGLREAEIDAGQRYHRERDRDPEPEEMMEIARRVRRAAPAQARQEGAAARPPQPDAGEREDQHADAHPADDRAAGIFGNRQVLVEAMEPAEERRAEIHDVERARSGRIEIDVDDPHRAAFGSRRAARHHDHRPALLGRKAHGDRLCAARERRRGAGQVVGGLRELHACYGITAGMQQRIEMVVPDEQRSRHRDRSEQERQRKPSPAVQRPPDRSQPHRIGHLGSPVTKRRAAFRPTNAASASLAR